MDERSRSVSLEGPGKTIAVLGKHFSFMGIGWWQASAQSMDGYDINEPRRFYAWTKVDADRKALAWARGKREKRRRRVMTTYPTWQDPDGRAL